MRTGDRFLLGLPLVWLVVLAAAAGLVGSAAAATTRLVPRGAAAATTGPDAGAGRGARTHPTGPGRRSRAAPPRDAGVTVVDRIVEGVALLVTDDGVVRRPVASLPAGVAEGAVLDGELRPWPEEAERRRREVARLRERLSAADDGGDIAVGAPW